MFIFYNTHVIRSTERSWIGVHEQDPLRGAYRWVDNTFPDLSYWQTGYPVANGGCVAMDHDGTWVNLPCDTKLPSVCVKPPGKYLIIINKSPPADVFALYLICLLPPRVRPSVRPSATVCLSVCMPACLPACLPSRPSVRTSVRLSVWAPL